MSSYTTEVRYICEHYAGETSSVGYDNIDEIISKSRSKVFDFDYTLYDENHKPELESKILSHYYTREIGFETVGLWKHYLKTRLNEILPYYNELYKTADLEYNPINDVNYVKEHHGTDSSTGTSENVQNTQGSSNRDITTDRTTHGENTSESNETSWNLYSDTPQGTIQNIDLETNAYLTNATKNTDEYEGSSENAVTEHTKTDDDLTYTEGKTNTINTEQAGENDWTETMTGKVGTYSYSKLIKEYREQILNIDLMIINDLSDLFMMLW